MIDPAIKPKPLWLSWATGPDRWVAISPHIYVGPGFFKDPLNEYWTPLIAHEKQHISDQNEMGTSKWLLKYLTNKTFKLHMEARGIAREIEAAPLTRKGIIYASYCVQLAGESYSYVAPSPALAGVAITQATVELGISRSFLVGHND